MPTLRVTEQGHPARAGPFRLRSACFGKPGASATVLWPGVLAPDAQRAGLRQQPAHSPVYGSFFCISAFLGSNGPSGGQIMLIAIMLALWRMYR